MDETNARYEPGKAHLRAKEFTEATAAFQKLTVADPQDAEAWQFLGAAQSQSKNWAAAVSAFRKAEALEPTARNRYNLAVALSEGLSRHDEARLYLERALEADPNHAPSKTFLKQVIALSAAPTYDPQQAQRRMSQLERQRGPIPLGRTVLGGVVAVVVAGATCWLWNLASQFVGSGPLVAYGAGWLVGLLTAKACGRGGRTPALLAGGVAGVAFVILGGILISRAPDDWIWIIVNVLAVVVGTRQAYRIALAAE